ncbi:MAG: HNH endonuclease [Blastocatellia bacterium]
MDLVEKRARHGCEYCQTQWKYTAGRFSIEHVIPRSRGGQNDAENLALACQHCNNHKYNNTEGCDPATMESAPLFNPRTQRWRDHFEWDSDYRFVIGLTPTGRATVQTLQLNRECLLNWRWAARELNIHPLQDDNFPTAATKR